MGVTRMDRIEIYFLIFIGMAILPVYIVSNGAPAITRKKALQRATNLGKIQTLMLRRFWLFHGLITCITTATLILLIEKWHSNPAGLNIVLILICLALITFSGILASMPTYVMVKYWKER